MKKVLLLICSIFGAALLHGGVLFENGKSDWQIVIPVTPDDAEKYAATELQTFLKKISGAELPIVNSDDAKPKQIIIITSQTLKFDNILFYLLVKVFSIYILYRRNGLKSSPKVKY